MVREKIIQKIWLPEEEEYLKENYGKIPVHEIAKTMKRSKGSIYTRAWDLHLTTTKNSPEIEQIEIDELEINECEKDQVPITIKANEAITEYILKLKRTYEEKNKEIEIIKEQIYKLEDALDVIQKG